jgi:hypothetical protein
MLPILSLAAIMKVDVLRPTESATNVPLPMIGGITFAGNGTATLLKP